MRAAAGGRFRKQLDLDASRYLHMKENATLTEPAACLLAVCSSIAKHLERPHEGLGRSLKRAASSLVLTCIKSNLETRTGAERARAAAGRCFQLLVRLDHLQAADPGVLHKGLHVADRILRALPEPETQTSPLDPAAKRKPPHSVFSLIPLAAKGFRSP